MGPFFERIDAHASFMFVAGGLVFLAYLINRFAPQQRRRIRRVVIIFGVYLAATVVSSVLHVVRADRLWHAAHFIAELLEVFTAITLLAVGIFDLALPRMSWRWPRWPPTSSSGSPISSPRSTSSSTRGSTLRPCSARRRS